LGGPYDRHVSGFEDYAFETVASALQGVSSDEARDAYVVSLLVYDEEDDPRRPTITVGFNTESRVAETTPRASDEAEARWNFAFWLQNELFLLGDSERDPQGAALRREWIEDAGLWYSDDDEERDFDAAMRRGGEITERFVAMAVRVVRALHERSVIERSFGRPIPALVHELEYYEQIADQNRAANPSGLVDEFGDWVKSLYSS
jgi:hypothetical protein